MRGCDRHPSYKREVLEPLLHFLSGRCRYVHINYLCAIYVYEKVIVMKIIYSVVYCAFEMFYFIQISA